MRMMVMVMVVVVVVLLVVVYRMLLPKDNTRILAVAVQILALGGFCF